MIWQKCFSMLERGKPFCAGERHQSVRLASNGDGWHLFTINPAYFLASKAILTAIPASTVAISQR